MIQGIQPLLRMMSAMWCPLLRDQSLSCGLGSWRWILVPTCLSLPLPCLYRNVWSNQRMKVMPHSLCRSVELQFTFSGKAAPFLGSELLTGILFVAPVLMPTWNSLIHVALVNQPTTSWCLFSKVPLVFRCLMS